MNPEKAEGLSEELQAALEPLLAAIESLSERIREYHERIEGLAQESYPQGAPRKQVKGVGTLIALTFLLPLEDAHRFRKSRDVGCYRGGSRDGETPARASRRCPSARKAISVCERDWYQVRSTFWDRWARIVICDAGD